MSIIHDALKKVQYRLDKKNPSVPAAQPAPAQAKPLTPKTSSAPVTPSVPASSNKMILVLIYAILISLGIILILVFKMMDKNAPIPVTVAAEPVRVVTTPSRPAPAPRQQPAVAAVSATAASAPAPVRDPSVLELGGTMLMGNGRVALINDDIYEVGQVVDGKKITDISLAEVKLVDEKTGSVTTLKVRNRK